MYIEREPVCAKIAFGYWVCYMLGLAAMGLLSQHGMPSSPVYLLLFCAGAGIVLYREKIRKGVQTLGFSGKNLKIDLPAALVLILGACICAVITGVIPIGQLPARALHYLFYIAAVEEILFRGFLQNYLFGLRINRIGIYVIGALLFSLMHLPFQVIRAGVSLPYYLMEAGGLSNLLFTFGFHLVMTFIARYRKNLCIPVALHFLTDFFFA